MAIQPDPNDDYDANDYDPSEPIPCPLCSGDLCYIGSLCAPIYQCRHCGMIHVDRTAEAVTLRSIEP